MKIEQARMTYNTQIQSYREQINILTVKKQELDKEIKRTPGGEELFGKEAATLELTIQKLDEKQSEYQEYMAKLMEQWSAQANLISSQQQGEAVGDAMEDLGKIMEIARRIMRGDIVPVTDERKLMEFDDELYQSAKNIGEMRKRMEKERKEHESLWEDEEPKEYEDPAQVADNTEAFAPGPEIVSVEETMASVEVPE